MILGDDAYMGDVVTLPAYRRRGHAAALCRLLLDDALEGGARHCVLASTPMATGLYAGLGFEEAMPLVGFQTVTA